MCTIDQITPDRGVAALVDGTAVAVFLLSTGELHAIDNVDPISGASVLSRGVVGEVDGAATVASPIYKQRFDLRTGRCLDAAVAVAVQVHRADASRPVTVTWFHVLGGVAAPRPASSLGHRADCAHDHARAGAEPPPTVPEARKPDGHRPRTCSPLDAGEQYRFGFAMDSCIGCHSCEVACAEQNGLPAGTAWRRVGEIEGGEYPDTRRFHLSMACNHCLDPACLDGCPTNAYEKLDNGIVAHHADDCIGCQYCTWNCPYSVPAFQPDRRIVTKCDMCQPRLEDGLAPACVDACPTHAITVEKVNVRRGEPTIAQVTHPSCPASDPHALDDPHHLGFLPTFPSKPTPTGTLEFFHQPN